MDRDEQPNGINVRKVLPISKEDVGSNPGFFSSGIWLDWGLLEILN